MNFTIVKGKHRSDKLLYKLSRFLNFSPVMRASVVFDQSCRYEVEGIDRLDLNKLVGFSIGWRHHVQSVRFAWRYDKSQDRIEIWAYIYEYGTRFTKFIGYAPFGEKVDLQITDHNRSYVFFMNYREFSKSDFFSKTRKFSIGYKLWPYFGGNLTAPHNMKLSLKIN